MSTEDSPVSRREYDAMRAADEEARMLKRKDDDYKGETHNKWREQLETERREYAKKSELAALARELRAEMKPAIDAAAQKRGSDMTLRLWITLAVAACVVITVIVLLMDRT